MPNRNSNKLLLPSFVASFLPGVVHGKASTQDGHAATSTEQEDAIQVHNHIDARGVVLLLALGALSSAVVLIAQIFCKSSLTTMATVGTLLAVAATSSFLAVTRSGQILKPALLVAKGWLQPQGLLSSTNASHPPKADTLLNRRRPKRDVSEEYWADLQSAIDIGRSDVGNEDRARDTVNHPKMPITLESLLVKEGIKLHGEAPDIVTLAVIITSEGGISAAQEAMQLTDSEMQRLVRRLETLGHISSRLPIECPDTIPTQLADFVSFWPTLKEFQSHTFSYVEDVALRIFNGADILDSALDAITTTWCQGWQVREELRARRIHLVVADRIETWKIDNLSQLTEEIIRSVIVDAGDSPALNALKRKELMQIYRKFSDEYRKKMEDVRMRYDEIADKMGTAVSKASQLVQAWQSKPKTELQRELDSIRSLLSSVEEGKASEQRSETALAQLPTLAGMIATSNSGLPPLESIEKVYQLLSMAFDVVTSDQAPVDFIDDEIAANVDDGSALRAVAIGTASPVRATKLALAHPELCKVEDPKLIIHRDTVEFHDEASAQKYIAALQQFGRRFAESLKPALATIAGSTVVQIITVEVRRVSMPEETMMLSAEAFTQARTVENPVHARKFLQEFNSHVPTEVTFGGMLFRVATVKIAEENGHPPEGMASQFANQCFEKAGCDPNVNEFDCVWTAVDTQQRKCQVQTSFSAFGPQVFSARLFANIVQTGCRHWRVVDRGNFDSFVAVWNVMMRHPEPAVRNAGRLVRNEYLRAVEDQQLDPASRKAMEHERGLMKLEGWCSDEGLRIRQLTNRSQDSSPLQAFVAKQCELLDKDEALDSAWEEKASTALANSFFAIRHWASTTHDDDVLPCFLTINSPLGRAIAKCAECCVSPNGNPPHPYASLRLMLLTCISDKFARDLLHHEKSSALFSLNSVQQFFRSIDEQRAHEECVETWLPAVVADTAALVNAVREIMLNAGDDALEKVERTLKSNLYENSKFEGAEFLRDCLQREFGLYHGGFDCDLTNEHLQALLDRLSTRFVNLLTEEENAQGPSISDTQQTWMQNWFRMHGVSKLPEKVQVDRNLFVKMEQIPAEAEQAEEDWEMMDALVHGLDLPINSPRFDEPDPVLPVNRVIKILRDGDEVLQSFVVSRLLERRFAVPLVDLTAAAFAVTQTRLCAGQSTNIVSDVELLRVAVVSLRDSEPESPLRKAKDPRLSEADQTLQKMEMTRLKSSLIRTLNGMRLDLPRFKPLGLFRIFFNSPARRTVSAASRCSILAPLFEARDRARRDYEARTIKEISSAEQAQLALQLAMAERAVADSVITTEHLMREIAQTFDADQRRGLDEQSGSSLTNRSERLPMLAALYLLDGFPLELVDGDCSWATESWLTAVMSALNVAIKVHRPDLGDRPVRVFVLSILGVQKAGKSSLLNRLFGCNFRISIERCTKGLNMQLVRSKRQGSAFDYVLVLDTEGVRAPDLRHNDNALVHDNRLALLAVWLADATLVLVNGNQSNDAQEILSIVKYVSDRSTGALGEIGNRLFFAMRSVSVAQGQSAVNGVRNVLFDLISNELRHAAVATAVNRTRFLRDFEPEKDIFILGNISMSDHPPRDVPDPRYGLDDSAMRERIHERCCTLNPNFRARSLTDFAEHFLKTQVEVLALEELLTYRSATERLAHEVLDEKISKLRQIVSHEYVSAFEAVQRDFDRLVDGDDQTKGLMEKVEEDIRGETGYRLNDREHLRKEGLIRDLVAVVDGKARSKVIQSDRSFYEFIKESVYDSFRDPEIAKWKSYLEQQKTSSAERIRNLVLAQKYFRDKVKSYKAFFYQESHKLSEKFPLQDRRRWQPERMKEEFDKLFRFVKEKARSESPPLFEHVEAKIARVYKKRLLQLPQRGSSAGWDTIEQLWIFWSNCCCKLSISSGADKLVKLTVAVKSDIRALLRDSKVYSDSIVERVIQRTEELLRYEPNNVKRQLHTIVWQLTAQTLKERQHDWDKKHAVTELLDSEECRTELFEYFRGVIFGQMELERLKEHLIGIF
ncbi:hypothetical protein DFJ73DRAFT_943011 [Zopfochytrium polystomum]|nr:hypothetical protein DFJ73DRAFT_943011 [Zopfochytrium polystomum]